MVEDFYAHNGRHTRLHQAKGGSTIYLDDLCETEADMQAGPPCRRNEADGIPVVQITPVLSWIRPVFQSCLSVIEHRWPTFAHDIPDLIPLSRIL